MMFETGAPTRYNCRRLHLASGTVCVLYGSCLCGLGISKWSAFPLLSSILMLLGLVCVGSGLVLGRSRLSGGFAAAAATMLAGLAIGYGFIATGEALLGLFLLAAFVTLCVLIVGIFASLLSLEPAPPPAPSRVRSADPGSIPPSPPRHPVDEDRFV